MSQTMLEAWLSEHADALDEGAHGVELLQRLGNAGLFRRGVPDALDGAGGGLWASVEAITEVARHSLTAAFVFWGQRAFIEYLLQSPNTGLRERWLPDLLAGRRAGATGLSNAMKFLCGIEQLGVRAEALSPRAWRIDGRLPWVTNLHPAGFCVAMAVARGDGGPPMVLALPSERAGLLRSADLDLIALRGSHTAALEFTGVQADDADVIHPVAQQFLPRVRPAFLGLQCALSIGLARAALDATEQRLGPARAVLEAPLADARAALALQTEALRQGLADGRFVAQAAELFRLRIALAETVQQATQLELMASGGRAYLRDAGGTASLGFARRWREAAFVPVVTPSLSQLKGELAKQALLAA